MEILIDSNLIYSALLKNGRIARLILNPPNSITFFAPGYLLEEINSHWDKIIQLSGLPENDLKSSLDELMKNIVLLNYGLMGDEIFNEAEKICANIDEKDTIFVAISLFFNLTLWTGDKKLRKGLEKQGYFICINTDEIYKTLFPKA
jgi:predicted nucleic acid-binding protein